MIHTLHDLYKRVKWLRRKYGKDVVVKVAGDGDLQAVRFIDIKGGQRRIGPHVEMFGPAAENGWKKANG